MDKRKVLGTIIGVLLFVAFIAGISFAYYSWQSVKKSINIGIQDKTIDFSCEGDDSCSNVSVNVSGIGPIFDYRDSSYYVKDASGNHTDKHLVFTDFAATNGGVLAREFSISLEILSMNRELQSDHLKYALLLYDKSKGNYSEISSGNFSSASLPSDNQSGNLSISNQKEDKENFSVPANTSYDYRFVVYIDGNYSNAHTLMGKSLNSKLSLTEILSS